MTSGYRVGKLSVVWEGLNVNYKPQLVFFECGDYCKVVVPHGVYENYDYRVVTWDIDSHGMVW